MGDWLARRRSANLEVAAAILAALAAAACGSSSSTTAAPTPVKCVVQVTLPRAAIEAAGGGGSIQLSTTPECAWTATTSVNWITGVSPASGQGEAQVRFDVLPNGSAAPREGHVSMNGVTARISQLGRGCKVALDPPAVSMHPQEGIGSVFVNTGAECNWAASTAESWIAVTAGATGTGNSTMRFRLSANGGPTRIGTIAVGDQVLVVTQASAGAPPPPAPTPTPTPPPTPACSYAISPTADTVKSDGKDGKLISVTTQAGCAWTAASNTGWLSITSATSGTGSGAVTWQAEKNGDKKARTGTLTIAGRTFTVTQEGR